MGSIEFHRPDIVNIPINDKINKKEYGYVPRHRKWFQSLLSIHSKTMNFRLATELAPSPSPYSQYHIYYYKKNPHTHGPNLTGALNMDVFAHHQSLYTFIVLYRLQGLFSNVGSPEIHKFVY